MGSNLTSYFFVYLQKTNDKSLSNKIDIFCKKCCVIVLLMSVF